MKRIILFSEKKKKIGVRCAIIFQIDPRILSYNVASMYEYLKVLQIK